MIVFGHFLRFCQSEPEWRELWCTDNVCQAMQVAYKGIMSSISNQCREEEQLRKIRDHSKLIEMEDWEAYYSCKMSQLVIDQLSGKELSLEGLSQNDLSFWRNHLILHMQLLNVKRAGIFADLKVVHLDKAVKGKGGNITIMVDSSKTFRTSGAANVTVSMALFGALRRYVALTSTLREKMLTGTNAGVRKYVFLNSEFKTIDSSDVNRYIKTAWNEYTKEECIESNDVTCTIIRKSMVTFTRRSGLSREKQLIVAKSMDHRIAQADQVYDVSKGIEASQAAQKIFRDLIASNGNDIDSDDSDTECLHEVEHLPKNKKVSKS